MSTTTMKKKEKRRIKARDLTLAEAFALWKARRSGSARTVRDYENLFRQFEAAGMERLSDLTTPDAFARWQQTKLDGGVKPVSINLGLNALSSVLRVMKRLGFYKSRALRRLRELRLPEPKKHGLRARFLKRDEFERLCAAARQTSARDEFFIRLITLSGLRKSEAARLRWERDVDLEKRELFVRHVPELGVAGNCKTGPRCVPICDELLAVLEREKRPEGLLVQSSYETRRGELLSSTALVWILRRARRRAGLTGITYHVLRHTRASWWIQAGVPLAKVAAWLGHSVAICAKHYLGISEGYDPEANRTSAPPSVLTTEAARVASLEREVTALRAALANREAAPHA